MSIQNHIIYTFLLICCFSLFAGAVSAQCISTFPYTEDFESFGPLSEGNSCSSTTVGPEYNGWTQDLNDNGYWNADNNGTGSTGTGPGSTLTSSGVGVGNDFNPGTGSGVYMYIEASNCFSSNAINLISPCFDFSAGAVEMEMAYHMFGVSMGSLQIDVFDKNTGNWDSLWSVAGSQGLNWNIASINLSSYTNDSVYIRISGSTGTSYESDIVIDDFKIIPLLPNDAGVTELIGPKAPCPGLNTVEAAITNHGITNIDTVTVNWAVNGSAQTSYLYTQPLSPGQTDTVTLGTYTFNAGTNYDLQLFTSNPNNTTDSLPGNDSLQITGLKTALPGGTYTIGGVNPDFIDFTAAVSDLNDFGVCGSVVFDVRTGNYNEQVHLDNIIGTSAVNTITFRSETADSTDVKLSFASSASTNNYVVRIENSDYVSFEKITFEALGPTYARVIELVGTGSDYISFKNNILEGVTGNTSANAAIFYSIGGSDHYFEATNNRIKNGSSAFFLYGTAGELEKGLLIENNEMTPYYSGIRSYYSSGPVFRNNNIVSNTVQTYNYFNGISLYYSDNGFTIEENDIYCGTGNYGIYLFNAQAGVSSGRVINNFVYSGGNSTAYGIYCGGNTSGVDLYHNSVNVSSGEANYGRAFFLGGTGTDIDAINNIFANTGGGYSMYVTYSGVLDTADYNDYYTKGNGLIYYNGTNYTDFQQWKSTTTNDAHSVSVNPNFFSGTDLHSSSSGVNNNGLYIPGVPTDIDGDIRDLQNPDIGADEFTPPPNDIGVIGFTRPARFGCDASDTTEVTAVIFNFGSQPQVNFDISYKIYSILISKETVTDTIFPGDSLLYTFNKTVDLSVAALYPFSGWTTLTGDQNAANDSLQNHLVISDTIFNDFPYIVDFEEPAGQLPDYWTNDPNDSQEDWILNKQFLSIPKDHTTGSSKGNFAAIDNSAPHSFEINLLSPCLDFSGMAFPVMDFYYYNTDATNSIELYVDVLSGGQWINVGGALGFQDATEYLYNLIDLSAFKSEIVKIRFRAVENGTATTPDIAIDDIKVYDMPEVNMGMESLVEPVNECGLSDIEKVSVTVSQSGYGMLYPQDTIPVFYSINDGPAVMEYLVLNDTLKQFETKTFSFGTFADLSGEGEYNFKIWTGYPGDSDYTNDTTIEVVTNVPVIDQFPYSEDFESGHGYWIAGGNNLTWQLGDPDGPYISGAVSGQNAWSTGFLNSNYNNDEQSWVISPCYDFSSLNAPQIALDIYWFSETGGDGTVLQYSTDGGQNWLTLGGVQEDINWYNQTLINAAPGGQNSGWSGTFGNSSNGWLGAKHKMDILAGQPNVQFRVAFGSNYAINYYDGFAFDNVTIGESPKLGFKDTIYACGSHTFDAQNPGAQYFWSTGETSSKITIMAGNSVQTHKVFVYVENPSGLYNSDTAILVLEPGPHVDLGKDTLLCGLNDFTLNANNPGMNYVWDDGSAGPTRKVINSGTYFVAVSNGQGCVKADTITLEFKDFPIADFSENKGATGTFVLTNNSQHADSFFWDFGDGFFSREFNPKHHYSSDGVYTISLIAYNECGADTINKTISTTGLKDGKEFDQIVVHPNPGDGFFVIKLTGTREGEVKATIFDLQGKILKINQYAVLGNGTTLTLDARKLPAGAYILGIDVNGEMVYRKLIIQ